MTTTSEKFTGQRQPNYCTLPKLDVEILPDVLICENCRREIVRVSVPVDNGRGHGWGEGIWVHADDPEGYEIFPIGTWPRVKGTSEHYVAPATRCRYCHTSDPAEVTFVRAAYSDETRCSRCGGVHGFGIGD
ncbi:MAG: hypothetical protein L0H78_19105 [Humibacillus sp.]|nr:hypothetical protein [Humibacillus sp.]